MKHKCTLTWVLLFALALTMGTMTAFAAVSPKAGQSLSKASDDNQEGIFDGNRIWTYMRNNGQIVFHHGGNSGCYWPGRASLSTINYASGMWVAGKVGGVAVTACAEYSSEWAAGKVLADGTPDDMYDPKYKMYKVNKKDALDPQSNPDWMNWPVEDGAPFIDANGNGTYDPLDGDMPNMQGGDQMIWYVMNDLVTEKHDNLFSSQPIGLECQVSIWGYNRPDEFGDMMFARFQLFNKKSTTVDSCYLGIWADVDLGDAGDDFVGCDPELGLGYTYNDGEDGVYGVGAPAIGYDFFQGAIVPSVGDTAKGWGKYFPDSKNLSMSTFSKYINGDDDYPDPESAQECWNYMAGYRYDGTKFIHPLTQEAVWPVLYAPDDPVEGTGWLDALDHPSGDRRQLSACGPFTLAPGDSQEIVTAMIIGQGVDALGSIDVLRLADTKAQIAYNIDFALPPSPPSPAVEARGLKEKIILTWDGAAEDYFAEDPVDLDADGDPSYYEFQGYNVYQLETDYGVGAKTLVATFDIEDLVQGVKDFQFVNELGEIVERTTQYGSDSKVQRYMVINSDMMRSNAPLINNRPYYFSVTAYGYNEIGVPKTLESSINTITVYPQDPFGSSYQNIDGDTLEVTHSGVSLGDVRAIVVDPMAVTGHDYKVNFRDEGGMTYWDVTDVTTGQVVQADQTNQADDGGYNVVDGLVVQVKGADPGIDFGVVGVNPYGEGYESYFEGWGYEGSRFFNSVDLGYPGLFGGLTTGLEFWGVTASKYVDIKLEVIADPGPDSSNWSKAYVIRRDLGYAFEGVGWFPGKLWNVQVDPPEQLNIAFVEDTRLVDANRIWDMGWTVDGDTAYYANDGELGNREYLWMLDSPYDAGESADLQGADWYDGSTVGMMYVIWPEPRAGHAYLEDDYSIYIYSARVNSENDVFTFSTAGMAASSSDEYSKADIEKINVFPNPYFGANVEEVQPLEHFVRFTHLPPDGATIRIYTLTGELVRELAHDNQTQYEEWDLLNSYDVPVASGMYIAHVDCGTLGEKVLKMAIIVPEERLRQW